MLHDIARLLCTERIQLLYGLLVILLQRSKLALDTHTSFPLYPRLIVHLSTVPLDVMGFNSSFGLLTVSIFPEFPIAFQSHHVPTETILWCSGWSQVVGVA
jgi:hypothetical protein